MKITQVEALVLRLPQIAHAADGTQDNCLIRIATDAGVTGWGEVNSCPEAVKAVVDAPLSHSNCSGLARVLVDLDPLAIEARGHRLRVATNYHAGGRLAVHAMAGIDTARCGVVRSRRGGRTVCPPGRLRADRQLLCDG